MLKAFANGGIMMKIIVAPDSFKGSLSAVEVAQAINKGIKNVYTDAQTVLLPVGDGGEGTMETLVVATDGEFRSAKVLAPLGNIIEAQYGVLGDGKTCVIETASASGLHLVDGDKLAPLQATTYGTGQLILQALEDGFTSFIIGLGGSATNDGGAGMLQALGMRLLDADGMEIELGGGALANIASIDSSHFDKRIQSSTFLIASDVDNPLIGENGASAVFGPQKGASPADVKILDNALSNFADHIAQLTTIKLHAKAGAGAAGGIGGAFQAFFPGEMQRGIDVVLDYIKLDDALIGADLVITGEGKVDSQTICGKTPMGVAQRAQSKNVPTIIVAGCVGEGTEGLYAHGVVSINSIVNNPMTLQQAIDNGSELLTASTEQIIRNYFYRSVN